MRGALSYKETCNTAIEHIEHIDPDIAVIPEAFNEGQEQFLDDALSSLRSLGYATAHTAHEDDDGRLDRRGILVIVKQEIASARKAKVLRIAGRNVIQAYISNPDGSDDIEVFGVHLDDRGENHRYKQATELLDTVNPVVPTVVAGDFNSVYKRDATGKTFLAARVISGLVDMKLMPMTEPESVTPAKTLGRIGSKGKRLYEIGSGRTIQQFIDRGFYEADPENRPTAPAKKPIAQLDHILVSEHFNASDFDVTTGLQTSDHLAISAELHLR